MSEGFIKLHRSLIDWEWWDDHNAVRLLTYLLVSVNWKDKKWKGQTIKAGSLVTSWDNLSNAAGLSKQQVRTAMTKLEGCGEVTRKSTNKWQAITLTKWDKLQIKDDEVTSKSTGNQQSNNTQITLTKESKEYKERKNNSKTLEERKSAFYKSLTPYVGEYGKEMIRAFFDYWSEHNENGRKMKFEMNKTFSIPHRLRTWKGRENDFIKKPQSQQTEVKKYKDI